VSRAALLGLFLAALVFALVMAWLPHPPSVPGNPNDKIQHIAAFTCLSLLGARAFPAFPLARLGERLSFLGAIIEVVQAIPALHRDCDIRDWIADTLAIIVVLLIVGAVRGSRTGQSRQVKQSVGTTG
jgi:peptidoglycan/LPS O-acetylase OafA/YrhL